MTLSAGVETWSLKKPFAIARGVKTEAVTVVARVSDGRHVGRGEATPYARYGETPLAARDQIMACVGLVDGPDEAVGDPAARRARLAEKLSAGAARNALDCALWDLEAKRTGRRVADVAGLTPPASTTTAVTLSVGAPDAMAAAARDAVSSLRARLLKVKLGDGDVAEETARLRAVSAAAQDARLIVDANEGWELETLAALDPICVEVGALFVEQPIPAEQTASLDALSLQTPLCADEACHTSADLGSLKGRYQVVNIKLDKTGGLTEAIALRAAALAAGYDVMIGCMVAGSLAMAPAYLLTQGAIAVDLDGPLLLAHDHQPPIRYDGATMTSPPRELWG